MSILIPCYNAERWIAQAVESALGQTWGEKEILVVDDGSTDGSLEIIKSFGDRIRWETGPNRGGNAARNRLLQLAQGDWLQYLDADDYLLPEKIAGQIQFLQAHPEVEILFSPFILENRSEDASSIETTKPLDSNDVWVLLARWTLPGTGSGLWRRQAIIETGGWNEAQPCCQEHELYLRLLMAGRRFWHCSHAGYVYRQWSEGTVCKRDRRETHRRRLEIEQRAEGFLRERKELTPQRLSAINQGRFETARMVWLYDPKFAVEIMRSIERSQPDFDPQGTAAPGRYRMVYHSFGFRAAERMADLKRRLAGHDPKDSQTTSKLIRCVVPRRSSNRTIGFQKQCVSILIPCYNAERWIAQAIESALGQTWPETEVVVLDDGSTDGSLEVIKRFGDRIRWETGPNRGGNVARNRLLQLARGEWLQYLDADDYLTPGKIAEQINFLAAHQETDVICGDVTLEHWSESVIHRERHPIPKPHDPWILLANWQLPQTGAALWRKQAILDVGGWKPDQPCCQEHELYLRLLLAGRHFTFYPSQGAIYRQWSERTVCKRDKPEVRRRRMEIELRAENFLRERGELTPARHWAINQARFEMARMAWQHDHAEAMRIMAVLHASAPDFQPGGDAAPLGYRLLWRLLGFRLTEIIADLRRPVAPASAN